jgi:hypothetical protein
MSAVWLRCCPTLIQSSVIVSPFLYITFLFISSAKSSLGFGLLFHNHTHEVAGGLPTLICELLPHSSKELAKAQAGVYGNIPAT